MPIKIPSVVHATYNNASPRRVFETLTTAEGWETWFTRGTTLDARPGGEIRLRWQDWGPEHLHAEDGGPVLEVNPDEKFVFHWQPGDSPTTVTFTLKKQGAGTLLEVVESGYSSFAGSVGCATGWGEALTLLKVYLEHGITYGAVP